ncbi:MarR family winged helix-turn-helix transcriptional regulator [Paenibacillus mendelii]|uniref:MarR family winged helix-turn-helix transcriptional regulator n=1 Tax=Paenibacillus mendelii TaxID=206163 RepID=A0ABV6J870_9BACL|nr:MarR family transcriptional regulator [Paenibacillus mendelii]MCQ6561365.1 MarR family transcriptional regulator [Paenibacillus mendelii]
MDTNNSLPTNSINKGSHSLGRLFLQLRRLERQPQTFGKAGSLTPSEIHTIEAIGCEGGILMNELATSLGVTKGAVSQLVVRLEAKQLVKRSSYPHDSRAVLISLTDKGKEAYKAHEEVHVQFYDQLRAQLSQQEIEIFEKCIDKLNEFLRK